MTRDTMRDLYAALAYLESGTHQPGPWLGVARAWMWAELWMLQGWSDGHQPA